MKSVFLFLCLSAAIFTQAQDSLSVYFPTDAATLTDEARATLDQWIGSHKSDATLSLKGHCDTRGSQAYNDRLSLQRVRAVEQYLLSKGLASASIANRKGWGERLAADEGGSEEAQQQNRRVDIVWQAAGTSAAPPALTQENIKKVQEGGTLRLENINFYGGRHRFLPQSMPALQHLLGIMKDNPSLQIEIQGHICCRFGSTEDGEDLDTGERNLSVSRARAVYDYLVENGIAAARLSYKGFAGTVPLVQPEYSEEDRTANRRVEIRIVKK